MSISIREINRENWESCVALKVNREQEGYVASNMYSIAEVQFLPNFEAVAIYNDETVVGFAMFGLDEDDHNYWIYRFMIDERYQGKGFGKAALKEIIKKLKSKPDCTVIMVGNKPDNNGAASLYKSVGFIEAGQAPWGESLARYE